jgi:hypothetical protein
VSGTPTAFEQIAQGWAYSTYPGSRIQKHPYANGVKADASAPFTTIEKQKTGGETMNHKFAWIVALTTALLPGHGLPLELLSPDRGPPTETVRGYLVGEFNLWGQWNNQTKVFDLVDDVVVRRRTYKLAFASEAMYREAERQDGMAVEIRAVRAEREDNEWYVVLSLEVLP